MRKPRHLALAFGIIAGAAQAASSDAIRLTEVAADGCSPALIYAAVLSTEQVLSKRRPPGLPPVMHDNCSDGSELVVGLNGERHLLSRPAKRGQYQPLYAGSPFVEQSAQVTLRGGDLILRLPETSESCGGEWRRVQVTVKVRGRTISIQGTLASSC
jgi:hypothetical protein